MAESEEVKKLLWLFRNQPPDPEKGEVDVNPVDAIYHLQNNTNNPYLGRAIAPETKKLARDSNDLKKLSVLFSTQNLYELKPTNRNQPFQERELNHPEKKAPHKEGGKVGYMAPEKLSGDVYKLPWMIDEFFSGILIRLRKNPREFDRVVEELLHLFHENNIRIKVYDAYYQLKDWNNLIDTLKEISDYPSPETFDLFCSALFAYYELVYPPEES